MDVYSSIVYNSQRVEIPKCSSVDVVYPYFEILSHHKKKLSLIYATTWVNLENMLSERNQTT